jgi:hypothetical protein
VAKATEIKAGHRTWSEYEWKKWVARCEAHPEDPECAYEEKVPAPPPPRAEVQPRAPAGNVEWIPGYWLWSKEDEGYFWIGGTYVVRTETVAKTPVVTTPKPTASVPIAPAMPALPPPPPAPTPPIVEPAAPTPAPQQEPPPPKVEVVVAPPAVVGAVWVPGHWVFVANTWQWVPGRWQIPPSQGGRYRIPEIRVRGGIRIYLPGGWVGR